MNTTTPVITEYDNPKNGGSELALRIDGKYYISSNYGAGYHRLLPVSPSALRNALQYTQAPPHVYDELFDTEKPA